MPKAHASPFATLLNSWLASMIAVAFGLVSFNAMGQVERAEIPSIRVGDRWVHEQKDALTKNVIDKVIRTIRVVSPTRIEGSYDPDGLFLWTTELNLIQTRSTAYDGDPKFLDFPLEVGKKWNSTYSTNNPSGGGKSKQEMETNVRSFERVTVPAGTFDAFRIESKGFWRNEGSGRSGKFTITNWYAPAARNIVKTEYDDGKHPTTTELVEVQLQP